MVTYPAQRREGHIVEVRPCLPSILLLPQCETQIEILFNLRVKAMHACVDSLRSLYGQAKSYEDTENVLKEILPLPPATATPTAGEGGEGGGKEKSYRVLYAVHEILHESTNETSPRTDGLDQPGFASTPRLHQHDKEQSTRFIGTISLISLDSESLALPAHLSPPIISTPPTLCLELAYLFLPVAWRKGFATESLNAVLEACRRSLDSKDSSWSPFSNLAVRAIVNGLNPASLRVMEKTGMAFRGVHELDGRRVWLAGEWREKHVLHVFGREFQMESQF